jgi:8-oxo-dGTP pyrophosphatase MutT (NUDIX family)
MSLAKIIKNLAPTRRSQPHSENQRRAAVLALFDEHHGELRLWFIRRAELGDDHSGQVAFPGGHLHTHETPEDAALRECFEEITVPHDAIEVMGGLDDVVSIFGTIVSPIIGRLKRPVHPVADNQEVARVFSVKWNDLAHRRCYRKETWGERQYPMHFWQLEGETIWGLTAFFVNTLIELEQRHE